MTLEERAIVAVLEYATARADHWLRSVVPEFIQWGHLHGPFCLRDDDLAIITVIQAWKLEETIFALQLFMPPLGAVNHATWYIPLGLNRDELPKRKRTDLIRAMEPTEWGRAASHLDELLASIARGRRLVPVSSAIPASMT